MATLAEISKRNNTAKGTTQSSLPNTYSYNNSITNNTAKNGTNNGGVIGGIGYVLEKFGLGAVSFMEGAVDEVTGSIAELFGNDELSEEIFANDWVNYNHADEWYDPSDGWKTAGDISGGLGNMITPYLITTAITLATGLATLPIYREINAALVGVSAAGNATKEAYLESGELGAAEFGYGALSGAMEMGFEWIGGKLMKGVSHAGNELIEGVSKKMLKESSETLAKSVAKSGAKSIFKDIGKDVASEAIEEGLSEIVSPYLKRLTYDPNAKNATWQEVTYAAFIGGMVGLVANGTGAGVKTSSEYVLGKKVIDNGKADSLIKLAEEVSQKESEYETGFTSFADTKDIYTELKTSLEKTGGEIKTANQKILLGKLAKTTTVSGIMPEIERSAERIASNPEALAAQYSEYLSSASGEKINLTAEQLTKGIDMSLQTTDRRAFLKQLRAAISTNPALSTLAIADATSHIFMDTNKFADAALNGKTVLTEKNFNNFLEKASDKKKAALAEKLGIEDLNAISIDGLNAAIAEFFNSEEGEEYRKRLKRFRSAEKAVGEKSKKLPTMFRSNMADGVYRYTENGENIALIKEGDSYTIFDYESRNLTEPASIQEVNKALREYRNKNNSAEMNGQSESNIEKSYAIPDDSRIIKDTSKNVIDLSQDDRLSALVKGKHGSERYNIIRDFILTELQGQPIRLSDGKQAIVDRSDAMHISHKAGDKKAAQISHIKQIVETAELYAEEESTKDKKFNSFWYYEAFVKYGKYTLPVYVNVGKAINDGTFHIYDITQNIRDTAHRINDVERPKPNEGYAQKNGISNKSIPQPDEKINTSDKKSYTVPEIMKLAKEKVKGYEDMNESKKLMVRGVIRRALANGFSESDAVRYARVAARSGVAIKFDKARCSMGLVDDDGNLIFADGFYDRASNEIVVNPEGTRSASKLLIHELTHAIYKTRTGAVILEKGVKNLTKDQINSIEEKYGAVYKGEAREYKLKDEKNAHYAEDILGDDKLLEKLLEDKPTLMDKILNFFKGAESDYADDERLSKEARKLYRHYKKLFDQFAERNQDNNLLADRGEAYVRNSGDESYALNIKYTDGSVEVLADVRELTNEQAVNYLKQAKSGQIRGHSYIPVRKDTPQIIIDTLNFAGERVDNLSLVMQVRKAQQAMSTKNAGNRSGNNVRSHALRPEDVVEIINKLDEPNTIILQTNRQDKDGNPLPNNVAVFVDYSADGKEGFAVIEFESSIDPEFVNDEFGDANYHTVVTLFEPDTERNGEPFDYAEELLSNPNSIDLEIIRRRQSQRSATQEKHPNTSKELPSNDSISQTPEKSTQSSEENSKFSNEVLSILSLQQAEALFARGVNGDALLNATDLARDILAVDGKITDDAKAILYHGTTRENANKIIKTGKMYGKEDSLYFSTKEDGIVLDYGEAVIQAQIPLEKLELNDIFDNEVHLTMKVKPHVLTNILFALPDNVDTSKVTVSKGTLIKQKANYESEKVFSKKDITETLGEIKEFSELRAKVRENIIDRLWQGYNSRVDEQGYEKYTLVMKDKLFNELHESSMTDEEVKSLKKQIKLALDKIVENGKPSIKSRMKDTVMKEAKSEVTKDFKLFNQIGDKANQMKDLKLGTFLNATQYKPEIFKGSIESLASIMYRGTMSVKKARSAVAGLKEWYTTKNPMLIYENEQNPGLYVKGVAEMLEELSRGVDTSSIAEKIEAGMTDSERYNILSQRSLSLSAKVDYEKLSVVKEKFSITDEDIDFSKYGDRVRLFKKIGEEFSVFHNYRNGDIVLDFGFSKENMRESVSKQRKNYTKLAKMLTCFDGVIENAIGIEVHNRNADGYKTDDTLKNVYVLASSFVDGENVIPVKLEVKEFSDKENTLHVAIALESINIDGIVKQEVAKEGVARQYSPPSSISISEYFKKINPSDESFYKYIPKQFFEDNKPNNAEPLNKTFSRQDLKMLLDVMSYFVKFVENYNKVWKQGKWVDAMPEAERYIDIINRNNSRRLGAFMRLTGMKYVESYIENFGDPSSVVRRMDMYDDGFFTSMFEELRSAAVRSDVSELTVKTDYYAFLDSHKKYLDKAAKETITWQGEEIPKLHAIGLAMTLKRAHAHAGILYNGITYFDSKGNMKRVGGVLPSDQIRNAKQLAEIANDQQKQIEGQFSEADKEYMSILEKGYNGDVRQLKVDRDIERLGFTNATEGYYYPIRRANAGKGINIDRLAAEEMDRVSSASFNKDTVKGAKQELFIESADTLYNRHVHTVCQYAHLSPALDTFNVLFNLDTSGNPNKPISVRTESKNTWKNGEEYFRKLITDIQGISPRASEGKELLSLIRGSYAKYQLGANPKVWFTQFSSIIASGSILDVDSITRGMTIPASDVDKYCPLALLRNSDNTAAMAQGNLDKVKHKIDKVSDFLMTPIGKVDRVVVCRLFGACQAQVEKNGGGKIGTEKNKVAAGELLEKVILETQQNSIATERSKAMRSESEFMRAITMFSSDSMKVIGRVIDSFGEISALRARIKAESNSSTRAELEKRLKTAYRQARKSTAALVLSSMFMAALAQLFRWIYNKDQEEEEIVETMVVDTVGNMFGGLPLIRDAISFLTDGYELENYTYSTLNDLLSASKNMLEIPGMIFSGEASSQDISKATKNLSFALGQITGLPVRNVYNVFYGLTKRFSPTTAYKIDNVFYEKNYKNDLYKAIDEGDTEMVNMLMSMLYNERMGDTMSESVHAELYNLSIKGYKVMPKAVASKITYNGEEIELAAEQQNSLRQSYSSSQASLNKLFSNVKYKALSDEDKVQAIKYIYELHYDSAFEDVLGIDGGKSVLLNDVFSADILTLYYILTKGLESDKDKDGKTISGTKKKKILAAIKSLGLSTEEQMLLLCAKGYSINDSDVGNLSAVQAKKRLLRYILNLKNVSKENKAELAKMCGFEVKNGKIIQKSVA